MKKREKSENSVVKTEKNRLKKLFSVITQRLSAMFMRPVLAFRLKGEPRAIYPSMSRREIKHLSAALCRTALQNAERK